MVLELASVSSPLQASDSIHMPARSCLWHHRPNCVCALCGHSFPCRSMICLPYTGCMSCISESCHGMMTMEPLLELVPGSGQELELALGLVWELALDSLQAALVDYH